MRKFLIILFLLIPVFAGAQTIWYIDPGGSDVSGDGSAGKPWASLYHACDTVNGANFTDDTIYVNAGTYTENTTCVLDEEVNLKGAGATSIITTTKNTDWWYILSLTSAEGTDGSQCISYLKFDGNSLTGSVGILVQGRSNVVVHDLVIEDFVRVGIRFQATNNTGEEPTTYSTGNEIYNCIITNCSRMLAGNGTGCLEIGGQDGMLIYNDTIIQTARAAGSNGYPIKYCDGGFNRGVKIYDNVLTKATYNGSGDFDFSIEFWDCRGGMEIYDNTLSAAIDIGGYITEKGSYDYAVYIHNNTIGPATLGTLEGTRGIILEGDWKGYIDIRYNHIKNVAKGISLQASYALKTIADVDIDYNLIENIGVATGGSSSKGWGIDWPQAGTSNNTVSNINIRNNVVIAATTGAMSTMWGIAVPGVGTSSYVRIINNIVTNFDYACVFGTDWDDAGVTLDYLYIQNNCFYGNGNSNDPRWGGTPLAPTNYTNSGNIEVDPEFTGVGDYTLQATSDCIDTGLGVGLTLDILGNAVGEDPDMGAYEYGASPPTPPPDLPEVTTTDAYRVYSRGAWSGGSSLDAGGGTITARGICYSTSANPTTSDNTIGAGAGTNDFTVRMVGLIPNTTYYVRAYVTNAEGTTYGGNESLTTSEHSFGFSNGKAGISAGKIGVIN